MIFHFNPKQRTLVIAIDGDRKNNLGVQLCNKMLISMAAVVAKGNQYEDESDENLKYVLSRNLSRTQKVHNDFIFLCSLHCHLSATLQTISINVANLRDNRGVVRIFIALLRFSFDCPSHTSTSTGWAKSRYTVIMFILLYTVSSSSIIIESTQFSVNFARFPSVVLSLNCLDRSFLIVIQPCVFNCFGPLCM